MKKRRMLFVLLVGALLFALAGNAPDGYCQTTKEGDAGAKTCDVGVVHPEIPRTCAGSMQDSKRIWEV